MLEKIVQIKNVGRFRNYSTNGDMMFRKLTLLYAENGRGKTTLCAILRSLQSGRAEYIGERKTLAAAGQAFVHLRFNGSNYQFSNDVWSVTYPDIAIFDPVFVNENVYSGDYVEHEHRKNLYRVIVGAQGVQLARQIEDLDAKIREANADIRIKKEAASRNLPSGVELEDYLEWQPVPDFETQIQLKTDELNNRQRAAVKSDEIKAKGLLVRIQIPSIPSYFTTVLGKQLTDIMADAEATVRQQVARHQMGREGESWLSQGLGYVANNQCPFCGQNVVLNDLIEAYRSHFNADYKSLKEEVAQLSQRINNAIGEATLTSLLQTISGNAALAEFWKQFVAVDLPEIPFMDIREKYAVLREQCLELAGRKQDNPIEAVTPNNEFSSALAAVESLNSIIAAYNAAVEISNTLITEQKAAVLRADDIPTIKSMLTQLHIKKRRFELEVIQLCQAYQDVLNNKAVLEQTKDTVRQQLDQHCQGLLQAYEKSINDFLDQFNAGFRITNTRHLYTGGTPSSHFQIEINNTALDLGDTRTPLGTPCFKTALSSGDRSALALVFFLAVLKHDAEIGRKIVVFDDPFTSLDRFRRTCTQQLIQQLAGSAEQVIVLSHDPYFLKLLWDECPSANTNAKAIQMSKAGDTTVIGEWDILAEAQSSYMKDFSTLLNFYRERKGGLGSVARTIRPFLEGMLRSHFPGQFQEAEWLGDFVGKIREAGPDSGLQHAKADINELEAINGYSKRYHHQQNANADTVPLDEDELHGYVKRTLKLAGGC
jgi:wobble nucleotide-excising tRNase